MDNIIEVLSKSYYSNIPFYKTIQTVVPLLKHSITYMYLNFNIHIGWLKGLILTLKKTILVN